MAKRFYIIGGDSINDEEATLSHAIGELEDKLKEGQKGWIKQFEYIDEDEIEYEQVWHRDYLKKNGKLVIIERW